MATTPRMNALDAGMFFAENATTPLQIAAVLVFEGPPPSYPDILREIEARLSRAPRYRQRVRTVPFNLARPVWDDDPHFQIGYHVRHTAVPPPGGDAEFRALASRVLAGPIDLKRAPWEQWIVEGLAGDRWALISKVHHCMVDGVAGADLMALLLDLSPDWRPTKPAEWEPARPTPGPTLLRRAAAERLGDVARSVTHPPVTGAVHAAVETARLARGLPGYAVRWTRRGAPSLNGPTTPHRHWTWTRVDLDEAKRIRAVFGGTVNDVVLASVTRGFRDVLVERGVLTDDTVVHAMVPVSVRASGDEDQVDNRVSAVLVNLPCGDANPLRRLASLRAQMDRVKHSHQAAAPDAMIKLLGLAPGLLATAAHTLLELRQPLVQTIVTNVPGPPFPLYMMGRRALEIHPYVPIAAGERISVGVLSYDGGLHFGLNGDFDAVPDLATLEAGIHEGFAELTGLVEQMEGSR